MINDDEEDDYNQLFNNISEKSSDNNGSIKMDDIIPHIKDDDEFKIENDELFLSELGNILMSNEDKSMEDYCDTSLDDI